MKKKKVKFKPNVLTLTLNAKYPNVYAFPSLHKSKGKGGSHED